MTERPNDAPGGPESLPDDAPETDLPPFAYNEAYWYGEGEDDRLVSDVSERYPDPRSGDDQKGIRPGIEEGNADRDAREIVADDVSPLLTLEHVPTENTRQNPPESGDSNAAKPLGPLLGTTVSERSENLGESPNRRFSKRVCYGKLLRDSSKVGVGKPRKTAENASTDCYGNLLREMPRGVFLRDGRFYLRRTLPADVQRLTGRAEIWRTLGTDSPQAAWRRFPLIAAKIEAEIESVRQKAGLAVDETLLGPLADDQRVTDTSPDNGSNSPRAAVEPEVVAGPTLGEAYARYVDDPTHAWTASTRQTYETTRLLATAVFGAEKPMREISRLQVRELVEVLRFLPRNATKLFPRLTLREAADRARSDDAIARISTANANAYLGNFSTFINWAVGEEIIDRNPARGLRLPDEVARRDKRHPFSAKQLKLILNAPLYTGCADDERGWATVGAARPRGARFWVPLIALHTGMRLNEICQLDVTDIRVLDGIACICVTRSTLVGSTDKRLKTGVSDRVIPVHPTLLDLGLARYADDKRREGQDKLFDDIRRRSHDQGAACARRQLSAPGCRLAGRVRNPP